LNKASDVAEVKVRSVTAEAAEPSEFDSMDPMLVEQSEKATDEFSALKVVTDSVASSVSRVLLHSIETSSKNSQLCREPFASGETRRRGMKLSSSDKVSKERYVNIVESLSIVEDERWVRRGSELEESELEAELLSDDESDLAASEGKDRRVVVSSHSVW
jgi:hypothetical protein